MMLSTPERGLVLPMSMGQIAQRAKWLGGPKAPAGFYRLEVPNGGTDPSAPDPFSRWTKPGHAFVNITSDCIGGAAWCAGFDRYQPKRMSHIYGGWINCDSMRLDADGPSKCFVRLERPELGCFLVYGSKDYDHDGHRDLVGHIMTVWEAPVEWDPKQPACWALIKGTDIAARVGRANMHTSGLAWYGFDRRGQPKDSWFIRSVMRP